MFKRQVIVAGLLLVCMSVMGGCEEAPVSPGDGDVGKEGEISLEDSQQYVSLEEARKQAEELEGNTVEDFCFPKHIEVPKVQEAGVFKVSSEDKRSLEEIKSAMGNIWTDYHTIDWGMAKDTYPYEIPEDYDMRVEGREDEKTGWWYSVSLTNGLYGFAAASLKNMEENPASLVAGYDFEWGDTVTEDSYMLKDGEYTVSEAVSYTERVLNESLRQSGENQSEYKVQQLYVTREHGEDDYCSFNMLVGKVLDGVVIDTSSSFEIHSGSYYDKVHSGVSLRVTMRDKNHIGYVNTSESLFGIEEESETDKIISPWYAVLLMNEQIAHVGQMSFSDCGLVYLMVQDNAKAENHEQDLFQGINDCTYLRPMWVFMSKPAGGSVIYATNNSHGKSIIVDAIDGTLYYYESTVAG